MDITSSRGWKEISYKNTQIYIERFQSICTRYLGAEYKEIRSTIMICHQNYVNDDEAHT